MDGMDKELAAVMERIQGHIAAREKKEPPKYDCEICKDTEMVMYRDENGLEWGRPCECIERKTALRLMAASGIRPEDAQRGFKEFETFDENGLVVAKQTAIRYVKEFEEIRNTKHNSLLLCGASGRGKTTLGLAVANNLMRKCVGVRYMSYRDEVTQLKQEITDDENYRNHINRLKTAKVLFIDDMLKGKLTESDVNIMYEIINYRYLERLPMIISTEKFSSELLDFDEAIGGRVLEMCKGFVVTFDKSIPNYRMR